MLSAGKKEDIALQTALVTNEIAGDLPLPQETLSLLELVKDPCCLLLPDGRILAANFACRSFLNIVQLTPRQFSLQDWIHPQDKAILERKLLLAGSKQQQYTSSLRLRMPAGNFQEQELQLSGTKQAIILRIGNSQHFSAAEAQEISVFPVVSLVFDTQLSLAHISQHFCQMLGYSEANFSNADNLVHPQHRPLFQAQMQSLARGENKGFLQELPLQHFLGHYLWVSFSASLVARAGEEAYITALVLNIDQLKTREEKLVQEQEDMHMFLNRVTHDMKGPLRSLMALYRLVELEFSHDAKAMEYFKHYQASVERLHANVSDLLTLSQVKKATPRLGMINLRSLVQDSLQSLCHLPGFYKITFNIRIEIKESVFMEENLLQTIIQNLLENAIKYSSEITPKVVVCIKLKNNQLLLEVSDNGIGISEEDQAKIFDMFYRATTRSTGTGLGLYILKNAVEKLNGNINLRSVAGKGSRFQISIPYHAPTPA